MLKAICQKCKKTFFHYSNKKGKFCSFKCYVKSHEHFIICKHCNKQIKRKRLASKYCSHRCFLDYLTKTFIKEKHSKWTGGKFKDTEGYIHVKSYNHPYRDKQNYVREHRLVMEEHLGRYLKPTELVHHINEDITDNRIENLKLFTSFKEHSKFHKSSQRSGNI